MPRSFWENVNKVSGLIELLLVCHPQGFGVLLGEVPCPSSREIHEMLNSARDRLPDDYTPTMPNLVSEAERIVYDRDFFDGLVNLAGGWEHIHSVSHELKEADSRMWSVVTDHVKFVGNSSTCHTSRLGYLAAKYSISPRTITKYRKEFPVRLAEMLLMPSGDCDNFYLLP